MGGLLIYGYSVGIRSSRALEHACRYSKDFIWPMSERTPDHDTIASFRRQHLSRFKTLFRTTVAACVEVGRVSMKPVAVNGTRVEANNGRGQTKTAEDLEQMLASIDARIETILAEADAKDVQEDTLFGPANPPNDLPREPRKERSTRRRLPGMPRRTRIPARPAIACRRWEPRSDAAKTERRRVAYTVAPPVRRVHSRRCVRRDA